MGEKIKKYRGKRTGKEIADLAGISQPYLSEIENNKAVPSFKVIARLALALHIPTSFLVDNDEDDTIEKIASVAAESDEVIKKIMTNPGKYAAASLLADMDENQLRKAFEYLSDQKQLGELQKKISA